MTININMNFTKLIYLYFLYKQYKLKKLIYYHYVAYYLLTSVDNISLDVKVVVSISKNSNIRNEVFFR